MVAEGTEVTVIGSPFLLSVHPAFRAIHVQDDPLMRRAAHGPLYPFRVQLPQPTQVLLAAENFRLEPAPCVGTGRLLLKCPPAHYGLPGRVSRQSLGIVGVLVPGQATID